MFIFREIEVEEKVDQEAKDMVLRDMAKNIKNVEVEEI